jgi:hypothetical protein
MRQLLRFAHLFSRTIVPLSIIERSKRSRRLRIAILSLLLLGCVNWLTHGPEFYPDVVAQSDKARYQRELALVFTNYEDLQLDPHTASQAVKSTGHLSVQTLAHDFEIDLSLNDLRAPGYRAEEVDENGVTRDVQMPAPDTYKGRVSGMPGSDARFSIDDDKVEGMILTSGESYFIESARKYSTAALPSDYVLYRAADVRADFAKTCGTLDAEISHETKRFISTMSSSVGPEVFSPFRVVKIATEADYEFVSALGTSSAANSEILNVMNAVQGIYQRDIGLTFTVAFQHTWATANDPYNTSGDAAAMLIEFTNYWNGNFVGQPRDVTHLWTGRDLGGSAGVAWQGVVCRDGAHAYGLSDLETMAPFRIGIPAHEIGHNFNATHCDGQTGCDKTIMVAVQDPANTLRFCPFSIDEIMSYVSATGSCLSLAAAGNSIDEPDFFVKQHYVDFLNRQADANGLAYWTDQITSCGGDQQCTQMKRMNVSAAFFLSVEFQQTGYLVERIYKTAYGDGAGGSTVNGSHQISIPVVRFNEFLPDTQQIGLGVVVGQSGWDTVLENNKQDFTAQFVQRARFINMYPSTMAPPLFVDTLNRNAGNPLSAIELAQLELEHTAGQKTRAQVLRQIAEHPNLVNAEFNRAFVLMQFIGYLRRNPNDYPDSDYTGYDFWLTKLNQFNGNYAAAEMVKAFLTSSEYRSRFGTP